MFLIVSVCFSVYCKLSLLMGPLCFNTFWPINSAKKSKLS